MSAMAIRQGAFLAPTSELSLLVLTPDQAQILYQLVREQRASITERWSAGIFMGLSESLFDIERAGGAYSRPVSGQTRPL